MKKTILTIVTGLGALSAFGQAASSEPSRFPCVVEKGFLYEKAAIPACHATTVVELPNGDMLAAFFGGTYEGHPDCDVWMCRYTNGKSAGTHGYNGNQTMNGIGGVDYSGNATSQGGEKMDYVPVPSPWSAPKVLADGIYTKYTKSAFSYDKDFEQLCHRDSIFDKTTWLAPAKQSGKPLLSDKVRKPCYNPVLYQIPGGDLVLDYKIGKWVQDWTGWEIRSKNGGKTWSHPRPLQTDTALHQIQLGPVKNKPVFSNGRVIAGSSTETGGRWKFHFETTDKKGKSWDMVYVDCDTIECIQPSILFLNGLGDGSRLKAIGRTRHGRLAQTYSEDNGQSWSKVTLSDMPNNNSGTDAITLKDGRHVLVYNDSNKEGVRTPLSVAISDDGEHWTKIADLETDHLGEYSYPCVIQASDGKVWVLYTWRRRLPAYAVLDLSKI